MEWLLYVLVVIPGSLGVIGYLLKATGKDPENHPKLKKYYPSYLAFSAICALLVFVVEKWPGKESEAVCLLKEIKEKIEKPRADLSGFDNGNECLDSWLKQSGSAIDSAIAYLGAGDCNSAMTHLRYAMDGARTDSLRSQVHFFRGAAYECLGDLNLAISEFDSVLEIDSMDINAWNWKAILQDNLGHYTNALATFDKALDIKPKNAYVLNNKSTTYFKLGKVDSALALCDSSLNILSTNPDALSNRCAYLNELGRFEEAMNDCRAAIKISQYHPNYLYNMGRVFASKEQYDSARYYFEGAIENRRNFIDAYANLANCYAEEGRFDEAIPLYEQILSERPNDSTTHYNLGRALFFSKRYDEALAHYDSALGNRLDYSDALAGKGACLAVLGKQILAGRAFLGAAKLFTSDIRMSEAVLTIRAALQADPMLKEEILSSPEFSPLLSDPEFRKLVGLD